MKRVLGIYSLLLLIPVSGLAQEDGRSELTRQLAEVLGFENMLSTFKQQGQAAADAQVLQMIEQVKKSMPGLPSKYMAEVGNGAKEYVGAVTSSWNEAEATSIYFSGLSEALSAEEMRVAIEHYRSDQGKKELKAIETASQAMATYILGRQQEASQLAMQTYVSKIRAAAIEAQRERSAASTPTAVPQPQPLPSAEPTKEQ